MLFKILIKCLVLIIKYKTLLDIFNPTNYRGSSYQYNSPIILSDGYQINQNNNNYLQSSI